MSNFCSLKGCLVFFRSEKREWVGREGVDIMLCNCSGSKNENRSEELYELDLDGEERVQLQIR